MLLCRSSSSWQQQMRGFAFGKSGGAHGKEAQPSQDLVQRLHMAEQALSPRPLPSHRAQTGEHGQLHREPSGWYKRKERSPPQPDQARLADNPEGENPLIIRSLNPRAAASARGATTASDQSAGARRFFDSCSDGSR